MKSIKNCIASVDIKLSINLKQYEQEMNKLLAILADYEKENKNEI